jgi:hypothetical protein
MNARGLLLCIGLLLLALPAPAQLDPGFMPKGGKTLLLEVLGPSPDSATMKAVVSASRSEAEWQAALADRTGSLSDTERRTLAAYLAVNMPLEPSTGQQVVQQAEQQGDWIAALPADGRELAWNYCQFCHSLFTSYLTIERNEQSWLNTFQTPFHREIELNAKQRETFARYSAINMPMKVEDVPPDLRF